MTTKPDATAEGIAVAFAEWLDLHDVSVPERLQHAVGTAFTKWLDAHSDELITAIAEAVAKRNGGTAR